MTSPGRRRFGIRPSRTRSTAALWAKSLLNALLFFAIFLALLPWGAHRLLPTTVPIPNVIRTVGGASLFVAGIALWVCCLDVFSRRGRGTPLPLDAPRHLVTSGPYAVMRNPIMTGELTAIWGEALWLASAGTLLYAIALTLVVHLIVVRIEEPELRQRFGESYEDYQRRVPRWLPRLRAPSGR